MEIDEKKIWEEAEKKYETIGKLMASGVAKGFSEGTAESVSAMEALTGDLLESERFYLEEKKRLQKEYEEQEEEKHRREYQIRLQKAKTYQQMETVRINEQLRLQKKSNEAYLASLQEALDKEKELLAEQKERIIEHFNEIAKRATASVGELNEAKHDMTQKLSDYGELFHERKITFLNSGINGTPEVFEDFVLDLSQERKDLEQYAEFLEELSQRTDIPTELYRAVREFSVSDALKYQEALLAMKPEQLARYVEDYQAIQTLSQSTADTVFANDMETALSDIEKELEAWYGTIPKAFFSEGELAAEAFGNAFVNKLKKMQTMLEEAVASVVAADSKQEAVVKNSALSERAGGIQNSITYILQSAGETVAEQLKSAKAHAAVEKLRGGY